jgi:hypothetical protein
MGLLSGVRLGHRLLQVQTEYERAPVCQVVTMVVHEGRVMTKREIAPPPDASSADLSALIDKQHAAMEQQIRDRAEALASKRRSSEPVATLSKEQYLEQGLERYRDGDLSGALELLTKAVAAFPGDRLLQANLNIVSAKLSSS